MIYEEKKIEKMMRKNAKPWDKKKEEMLNYSLELSKAQITFRIKDIQQFEK